MKTALITGITGQDGAYLARLLIDKGYRVVGAVRRSSSSGLWRLRWLGVHDNELQIEPLDLLEQGNVMRLIARIQPDEIYNLAAMSFVGTSFEEPLYTMEVNALGTLRLLEAIRTLNRKIKLYQASTSEMFGKVQDVPQNEETPFNPRSPYAIAKLAAHWSVVNYREAYGIYACSGILFNHESPLRGAEFVTQKIAQGLARQNGPIYLGNLEAKRDWGFAGDYVEGIWRMMQHGEPGDYVLATGTMCSVREFVGLIAHNLEIDLTWKGEGLDEIAYNADVPVIKISGKMFRPTEVDLLCGNATKAYTHLGWIPATTLPALATMMARAAHEQATTWR